MNKWWIFNCHVWLPGGIPCFLKIQKRWFNWVFQHLTIGCGGYTNLRTWQQLICHKWWGWMGLEWDLTHFFSQFTSIHQLKLWPQQTLNLPIFVCPFFHVAWIPQVRKRVSYKVVRPPPINHSETGVINAPTERYRKRGYHPRYTLDLYGSTDVALL